MDPFELVNWKDSVSVMIPAATFHAAVSGPACRFLATDLPGMTAPES